MDAFYLTWLIASFLDLAADNATRIINGVALKVLSQIVLDALRRR